MPSIFPKEWKVLLLSSFIILVLTACGGGGSSGSDDDDDNNGNPPPNNPPTTDTTSPAQITNLTAQTASSSSIELSWTASGDDGNQGTASEYDIRYSTSSINNGNWGSATRANNEPLPGVNGSAESFVVSGLSANTQYFFAVKVLDEANNESALSNVDNATTNANQAGAETVAGAVTTPYPTIKHISIEWEIDGDDDEDGAVSVRYRPVGTSGWQQGMNLIRVPAGNRVLSGREFTWTNKHSGSLFDLEPDTEYEIELTLNDPDSGEEVRIVTARTRPIPEAPASANVVNANPASFSTLLSSVNPGDILLLEAGNYSGFSVAQDGTADQPIVIRGENADTVIVNGSISLNGRQHVYIERLTVNGGISLNNGEHLVVRESNINTSGSGITALGNGVINAYIVDNTVIGPTDWNGNTVGAQGANQGEGIQLTGPGNVIAYNYVRGFRDAISTLEASGAVNQISIDIYNNDVDIGADDAIEADFTMGNARILNNRIANSFIALSAQPSLGGPTYFIRNVMYNIINTPFKMHRGSIGDIAFHNTVVKCGDAFGVFTSDTWSRSYFRNNVFIGGEGGGTYGGYSNGNGAVANLAAAAANTSFDYDAYGSIGTGRFDGRIRTNNFDSLAEMRAVTTEAHAQQIDLNIFAEVVAFPDNPFPAKTNPDLRLQSGNDAIDNGVFIPGINDNYAGNAPDIGAYELGDALPQYGPRN